MSQRKTWTTSRTHVVRLLACIAHMHVNVLCSLHIEDQNICIFSQDPGLGLIMPCGEGQVVGLRSSICTSAYLGVRHIRSHYYPLYRVGKHISFRSHCLHVDTDHRTAYFVTSDNTRLVAKLRSIPTLQTFKPFDEIASNVAACSSHPTEHLSATYLNPLAR